ncbi:hypothetical protein Tco_1440670 [Tanacetum coccineum]
MSLSLAEYVIVAGADNRPSMLDKTNYSSWASCMLLYNKGKEHGKLLVDSVLNGPFQYETMVKPGNEITPATIRARTYTDLTDEEKIHESVDIKATNIVLQGLPQDIYNLVSHNEDAKQICDRVKLLVKGSELSLQERESKLYDDFDTFTYMPEETIHSYYMRTVQGYKYMGNAHHGCQGTLQKSGRATKLKRPKNSAWFKEKMLLSEALESGAYLDLKQLTFLIVRSTPAKAVLMANLSSYDSDVLSDDIKTENPVVQSNSSPVQQDDLLMSVIEEMSSQIAKCNKVIKEELEKLGFLKINDDSFACNTPLGTLCDEINWLNGIHDDLFTYEVVFLSLLVFHKQWMKLGSDADMEYDPFNVEFAKCGHSKWPTCSWKDDGYCNGGNLPGAYIVGNTLRYKELEWYEALKDGKLKDEALKNKAIMEGIIDEEEESNNDVWRRWDDYDYTTNNHEINDKNGN